jgi:hypothetical protein
MTPMGTLPRLVIALCLALPAVADTAPPAPAESGAPAEATPASPQLLAWIHTCVEQLDSPDERVRASAASALRATGSVARPALEVAAAGADPELASHARRVLDQIARAGQLPRGGDPRKPTQRTGAAGTTLSQRIVGALGLEAEQAAAVGKILDGFEQRRQELVIEVQAGKAEREGLGPRLETLRTETDASVDQVLDDEQMARYRALIQPPARGAATGEGPAAPPPAPR